MYLDVVYNLLQAAFDKCHRYMILLHHIIYSVCRDVSLMCLIWIDMRFKVIIIHVLHQILYLDAADTKHGASLVFL